MVSAPGINPSHDLHPIFITSLPLKDQELIEFWRVFTNNCYPGANFSDFWVPYLVGVPQTKPLKRFAQNVQDMFAPKDLELIRIWGISGNNCCHGNALNFWGSYTLWVFHKQNIYRDFHQIFKMCSPLKDLKLIRFCGVSSNNTTVLGVLKILISLELKSMHVFHQIFSTELLSEDPKFICFWLLASNNCCHSNTFNILGF